ncbi:hypothetical protein [Streptomyces sp. NPDC088400]|uniref:hypothetical protein n=1 Tax=Streptomyces sp. NPDC088400 TaxID=3365861 RepID=UPI003810367D
MLRNVLDARPVRHQQRQGRTIEWYDDVSVPLSGKTRADIDKAHQRARRSAAATPRGKIIAELSFGFWRFLLARQYRASLRPSTALAHALPRVPAELSRRPAVAERDHASGKQDRRPPCRAHRMWKRSPDGVSGRPYLVVCVG